VSHTVEASINYLGPMSERPAFHAHDLARDNLRLSSHKVRIQDARHLAEPPRLDRQGFTLVRLPSVIDDFEDASAIEHDYLPDIARLLTELTGATRVVMMPRGVLRFGERSRRYRSVSNSHPARFVHVDYTERSAPGLLQGLLTGQPAAAELRQARRYAGFNVWRALSPPPQDVPLALCDACSVAAADLVAGDAVFDAPGVPEFSFEAYLVRHNPAHRWFYYSAMQRDEVLVFKAFDTDAGQAVRVPHVAFDDPACPPEVPPRESIEVRGFALFE